MDDVGNMNNYRDEMTAKERLAAYNRGELVDHQPYSLMGPDYALANIFGYTTTQFNKDFNVRCQIIEHMKSELGIETLNVGLSLRALGAAMGSVLYFPANDVDRIEKYAINNWDDFDKLEPVDPYNNPVLTPMLQTAKKLKDKYPDLTLTTNVVGPISNAIAVMEAETFLKDTVKNPEMVCKLLDLCVENSLKWVQAFHNEFGSVGTSFNDPVSCADMISKRQFEKFSLPYMKKLIDGIELIMGAKPGAHICGKTKPIWNDLVSVGVGFFGIDNCEDLQEAKEQIGSKMRIAGNVPPVEVMLYGTPEDVVNSCIGCLKKAADNPCGYIVNTGCQVPIGTSRENLEAFLYAVRRYGRGARLGHLPEGLKDVA